SRCSITDDAATLLLGTSVLSSLKGGGLRQAEDPVNPLQPSPILSTKPGQLHYPPVADGHPRAQRGAVPHHDRAAAVCLPARQGGLVPAVLPHAADGDPPGLDGPEAGGAGFGRCPGPDRPARAAV